MEYEHGFNILKHCNALTYWDIRYYVSEAFWNYYLEPPYPLWTKSDKSKFSIQKYIFKWICESSNWRHLMFDFLNQCGNSQTYLFLSYMLIQKMMDQPRYAKTWQQCSWWLWLSNHLNAIVQDHLCRELPDAKPTSLASSLPCTSGFSNRT